MPVFKFARGQADKNIMNHNQKGFSLTEILVTLALLSIVTGIATISYNSYLNTAHKRAVRIALNKIENSFGSCMSFNQNKGSECDTFKKIGYKPSLDQRSNTTADTNKENICFVVRKKDGVVYNKEGLRACIQFKNGSIVRKCFEGKDSEPRAAACGIATSQNNPLPGFCCHTCTNCEVWEN